ncbi:hypothetical protein ID866_12253, partial [Astraeus odoratus]
LPWLFDNNLCDFTLYHICFKVSIHYSGSSLSKWTVHTNCPNHFCGNAGCASPGFVSVTVSSSTVSSTVEHHNISVDCLTPSPPS